MKTLTTRNLLASVLLPAFLYVGCSAEGLTGPAAVNDGGEASAPEEAGSTGSEAADHCIEWAGDMICPDTYDPSRAGDLQ